MCGILAYYNFSKEPVKEDLVIRMRDTMLHRGPDDAGIFLDNFVALAHRRLSIIDLTDSGHQPMKNEDGSVVITYNGEIYNYQELREDLVKRGHVFTSSSDTEVIVHQYEEDGEACVKMLNGMFSFVIWDRTKRKLFAARDRMGIKPLYYYYDKDKVIISSEIKAIVEDPSIPRNPDYQAVADYNFAGRPLNGKTMYEGIKELEPGHTLVFEADQYHPGIRRYWDLVYEYNYTRRIEDVVEELSGLLDDAVRIHCRSDAPLGCHLSGGLDTSAVVAFAASHKRPLKTFSIKFSDDPFIDETRFAKAVAKQTLAEYYELCPTASDMAGLLPRLIWHMDQPMSNEGGFSYYTASRFSKEQVKVSLTGHGGDEIFAGYPAQFIASYNDTSMFDLHRDPGRELSFAQRVKSLLLAGDPARIWRAIKSRLVKQEQTFEQRWIKLHCGQLPEDSNLYRPEFKEALGGYSPLDSYLAPFERVSKAAVLDKCLYHDLTVYLPSLLHLEDRASMSVSLESRVPLLDYRVVEFLATIPPEQKVRGLQPKYLLRETVRPLIPEEVVERRDKKPFPVPGKFWSSKEMKDLMQDVFTNKNLFTHNIFNPEFLTINNDFNKMYWKLINIELWHRIFINGN